MAAAALAAMNAEPGAAWAFSGPVVHIEEARQGRTGRAGVDGGGVAAVVAAMGRHTMDADLQFLGCGALANLAVFGGAACKQAVVDGGGVAVLVAALGQDLLVRTHKNAACALQNLAANPSGAEALGLAFAARFFSVGS